MSDFLANVAEERGSSKAVLRTRRDTAAVLEEMGRRFPSTWKSGRVAAIRGFSFESPAALFRVLSPKRWQLIERLQSLGPTCVRGLARTLERDVKRVPEVVAAPIEVVLIEKTADGKVQCAVCDH